MHKSHAVKADCRWMRNTQVLCVALVAFEYLLHIITLCGAQTYRAFSFCGTIEYMAPELVKSTTAGHDFVSNSFIFALLD